MNSNETSAHMTFRGGYWRLEAPNASSRGGTRTPDPGVAGYSTSAKAVTEQMLAGAWVTVQGRSAPEATSETAIQLQSETTGPGR